MSSGPICVTKTMRMMDVMQTLRESEDRDISETSVNLQETQRQHEDDADPFRWWQLQLPYRWYGLNEKGQIGEEVEDKLPRVRIKDNLVVEYPYR